MALDPLSVFLGALSTLVCVGLYGRLVGRRRREPAQNASERAVRCLPCEADYPDWSEAREHAKSAHNAHTDSMADHLLEEVEHA